MEPMVPETWKPHLHKYLGENRDHLSAQDFPASQSVFIHFPDGSHVLFRYAFLIIDEERRECIVFTEHCGYHVFPAGDTEIEILKTAETRV